MIKLKCVYCKKIFQVYPSAIKKGGGKYCSQKCYDKNRFARKQIICKECGEKFIAYKSAINKKGRKFCCRTCYLKYTKNHHPASFQGNYRNCLTCGKKFHVPLNRIKSGRGKYCCHKCKHEASLETIICKSCGKKFSCPRHRNQSYCCHKCFFQRKATKNPTKYIQKKCLQCGKQMSILRTRDKVKRGKFCSKECYSEWMSIHLIKENAPSWRGGITPFYRSLRTLKKYRDWRKQVLAKDQHTCQMCGKKNCLLEVDHIVPLIKILFDNKIKTLEMAKTCKELWAVTNGQTLCRKCHHAKSREQRLQVIAHSKKYHCA